MKILSYGRLKSRARNVGEEPAPGARGDKGAPAKGDAAVRQALLMQLALKALDRVIADYRGLTHRPPSYAALSQYLDELERGEVTATRADTPALLQPRVRAVAS